MSRCWFWSRSTETLVCLWFAPGGLRCPLPWRQQTGPCRNRTSFCGTIVRKCAPVFSATRTSSPLVIYSFHDFCIWRLLRISHFRNHRAPWDRPTPWWFCPWSQRSFSSVHYRVDSLRLRRSCRYTSENRCLDDFSFSSHLASYWDMLSIHRYFPCCHTVDFSNDRTSQCFLNRSFAGVSFFE